MAINSSIGARLKGQQQTVQMQTVPSPINGIDARVPLSSDNPNVCIYAINLVPNEYGVRVRNGYREWQIEVNNGLGTGIGTIIAYADPETETGSDKLFAVNNEGIWDVTTAGGTPILMQAFPDVSSEAGFGNYINYIDESGASFVLYADSIYGLWRYTASSDTWEQPTDITGISVADIKTVIVHKLRMWFTVKSNTLGYYLPINSQAGACSTFNFGGKFKAGGEIVGLYNWTVDGGIGVDDYLLVVSRAGDVLTYVGSDPTQPDWFLTGTYFVGQIAKGSRCISSDGGNVTILSAFGLTQMSDLLRGVDPRLPNEKSIGSSVAPFIRDDMRLYITDDGWSVKYLANEGVYIVVTPERNNGVYTQYVYNISVDGWGTYSGTQMECVETWRGNTFFADKNGRVLSMDVNKDNVLLTPEVQLRSNVSNGDQIEFSLLTSFNSLGAQARYKRGKMVRADFLSQSKPSYTTKFLYDYDTTPIQTVATPPISDASLWDVAIWDAAIWESGSLVDWDRVSGATGLGRYVAVAIRGKALTGTILASMDIFFDWGGGL